MASETDINISGHYVVSINAMPFSYMYFELKNERSGRIVYIVLKSQRPSDTVF